MRGKKQNKDEISETKPRLKYRVGIDEAGRGPLAGPVAVGACVFYDKRVKNLLREATDSKKMTALARLRVFKKICDLKDKGLLDFSVCFSSNRMIDEKGIVFAINKALKKSLSNLNLDPRCTEVLMDGGLHVPNEYKNQRAIIRGDSKIKEISVASICAKVMRDNLMSRLSRKFPNYGLDIHMGYGTKMHREAIKQKGLSVIHRKTFCKNIKCF